MRPADPQVHPERGYRPFWNSQIGLDLATVTQLLLQNS